MREGREAGYVRGLVVLRSGGTSGVFGFKISALQIAFWR